jgi:hypothetical protein
MPVAARVPPEKDDDPTTQSINLALFQPDTKTYNVKTFRYMCAQLLGTDMSVQRDSYVRKRNAPSKTMVLLRPTHISVRHVERFSSPTSRDQRANYY